QESVSKLSIATNEFVQNTNEENLLKMRAAWVEAVTNHQHCTSFGFGPANLSLGAYGTVLGVFPVDEEEVEANILKADVNLARSFSRDVRGFFTVEYLIYGNDKTEIQVIESFDQQRKDYLLLVIDELTMTTESIVNNWKTDYREKFINNDGTAAGSSVSILYNEFVKDYENIKNYKVELPAGLTAGQVSSDPTLVEAYYSGISKQLIREHFSSSKNIWMGQTRDGQDIISFEEYLVALEGGPTLVAATKAAIVEIDNALAALPDVKLSEMVDSEEVVTLRTKLQANTANFKSSMSSLLGISITFNSGDGD
ncbi:MAG: imelysin family protein, partial [Cyclobacteriaceae bacterium]